MAAVYRYGAPPKISALAALMNQQAQEDMWRSYVADMAWAIARKGVKKFPVEPYSKMVSRKKASLDSRTGQEIMQDIVKRRKYRKANQCAMQKEGERQ